MDKITIVKAGFNTWTGLIEYTDDQGEVVTIEVDGENLSRFDVLEKVLTHLGFDLEYFEPTTKKA